MTSLTQIVLNVKSIVLLVKIINSVKTVKAFKEILHQIVDVNKIIMMTV
jgi:hypothetical protein